MLPVPTKFELRHRKRFSWRDFRWGSSMEEEFFSDFFQRMNIKEEFDDIYMRESTPEGALCLGSAVWLEDTNQFRFHYLNFNYLADVACGENEKKEHELTLLDTTATVQHESDVFYYTFCPIGSCNGYICLGDRERNPVYLLDPLQGRYLTIQSPDPEHHIFNDKEGYTSGFGYDERTGVYKVLKFYYRDVHSRNTDIMFTSICTVDPDHGPTAWKSLYYFPNVLDHSQSGVFYDGKLHFFMCDERVVPLLSVLDETDPDELELPFMHISYFNGILQFDLHTEEFSEIQGPPTVGNHVPIRHLTMGAFGDELYLLKLEQENLSAPTTIKMWLMDRHSDGFSSGGSPFFSSSVSPSSGGSSWIFMFDMPEDPHFWTKGELLPKPLMLLPDGRLIMHCKESFFLFDPDENNQSPYTILLGGLNVHAVFPIITSSSSDLLSSKSDGSHNSKMGSFEAPTDGKYYGGWSTKLTQFDPDLV
ncbi:hypothetical protein QJS10_CPB15g00465 [Acorus calamus]|uniref:F-box associated beta-propeller type 1 domain-containing protein n=1 Tax=Acorus calamus TaxID=4465 RepID=A0AAV9D507_ACOCL|nr:hypothetical protein QJS10_CPB15g00465 [Acorus calamus]